MRLFPDKNRTEKELKSEKLALQKLMERGEITVAESERLLEVCRLLNRIDSIRKSTAW